VAFKHRLTRAGEAPKTEKKRRENGEGKKRKSRGLDAKDICKTPVDHLGRDWKIQTKRLSHWLVITKLLISGIEIAVGCRRRLLGRNQTILMTPDRSQSEISRTDFIETRECMAQSIRLKNACCDLDRGREESCEKPRADDFT